MSRLDEELQRLYGLPQGERRALVLELARPADWDALGRVWRGVQADLELPAPAIAVSGSDGLQLWFSLQQPVDAGVATALLTQLQARYLPELAPTRVRLRPAADGSGWPAGPVPAPQPDGERWSAFIAPDLAPVFADTPWLDLPPGTDGQADLLAPLQPITPAALDAALAKLAPASPTAPQPAQPADLDPRRFLQSVVNDATAPLALRIQAAQALLTARDQSCP
ncbi:MAG: hypothetical protein ACK4R2_13425 [Roseateles sp.]